jgi:hypothetical protein
LFTVTIRQVHESDACPVFNPRVDSAKVRCGGVDASDFKGCMVAGAAG